MKNAIILENIEPFNEIFYRSCSYCSLFSIVKHFNKSITPFLLNDIFIYAYDKNSNVLRMDETNIVSVKDILKQMNISRSEFYNTNNLILNVTESLNKQRPVILYIDCFYESIRPDAYRRNHYLHSILIYGVNAEKKMFNIIEHKYRGSGILEKCALSFEDAINSYNGASENFPQFSDFPDYFDYFIINEGVKADYDLNSKIFDYTRNLLNKRQEVLSGLNYIKMFTEDFRHIVADKDILYNNINKYVGSFSTIIDNKRAERYKMIKCFNSPKNLIEDLDKIITVLNFIRGILAKYKYSSKFDKNYFDALMEKLILFESMEKEYYESYFRFLELWGLTNT